MRQAVRVICCAAISRTKPIDQSSVKAPSNFLECFIVKPVWLMVARFSVHPACKCDFNRGIMLSRTRVHCDRKVTNLNSTGKLFVPAVLKKAFDRDQRNLMDQDRQSDLSNHPKYHIWINGSGTKGFTEYESGCPGRPKSENPIKAFSRLSLLPLVNMLSAEAQPYAFQFDPAKTALVLSESVYL